MLLGLWRRIETSWKDPSGQPQQSGVWHPILYQTNSKIVTFVPAFILGCASLNFILEKTLTYRFICYSQLTSTV